MLSISVPRIVGTSHSISAITLAPQDRNAPGSDLG